MSRLFELDFIDRNELASVTGLLPGRVSGKLKKKDGSRKYTNAIDSRIFC